MKLNKQTKKLFHHNRRKIRTRARLFGTTERPRLSVYKSNKHIYAQIINDEMGATIVSSSDKEIILKKEGRGLLKELAARVGADVAKKAKIKKINKVVYDRGGFLYTGAVKALADAARKEGLVF
ncbi:MAG: 50S ribosomal protein L18 [Parcubacteria group bacterium]|nr:50S ribosomal protein L18 [Parcubacteria group bacterium]